MKHNSPGVPVNRIEPKGFVDDAELDDFGEERSEGVIICENRDAQPVGGKPCYSAVETCEAQRLVNMD
jgi:hypothetical protein